MFAFTQLAKHTETSHAHAYCVNMQGLNITQADMPKCMLSIRNELNTNTKLTYGSKVYLNMFVFAHVPYCISDNKHLKDLLVWTRKLPSLFFCS